MSEVVDFCRRLIQTKSFSGSEQDVAGLIAEEMDALGFDKVEVDRVGNVAGLIKGTGSGTIVFDGHMDTVEAGRGEEWSSDPFSAEIADGFIVGRGAVDMKGALASMIYSASKLGEVENTLHYVFVVHEEDQEGFGIRHFLDESGVVPDLVVLGEATGLSVAIGHRGRAEIILRTKGRVCHSSMPDLGSNALMEMCEALLKVEEDSKSLPAHPKLGRSTMAPVSISCSPGKIPMIPDSCEVVLDRRLVPGETREGMISHLKDLLPGLEVEIRVKRVRCYTEHEEEVEAYFPAWYQEDEFSRRIAKELRVKLIAWRFGTDGSYTAGQLGLTTIGYGPGDERLAHSPDERLRISELLESVGGYAKMAKMRIHTKN